MQSGYAGALTARDAAESVARRDGVSACDTSGWAGFGNGSSSFKRNGELLADAHRMGIDTRIGSLQLAQANAIIERDAIHVVACFHYMRGSTRDRGGDQHDKAEDKSGCLHGRDCYGKVN